MTVSVYIRPSITAWCPRDDPPDEAEAHPDLVSRLESLRKSAAIAMGLATDEASVPEATPKILMVSPLAPHSTLFGENVREDSTEAIVRSLSGMGFHHALQITASLATAAAAKIDGAVVATNLGKKPVDANSVTLNYPGGALLVTARFDTKGSVSEATVFRTVRRIMEGQVFWKEV